MQKWPTVPPANWSRAQELRKESTKAEQLLWENLRNEKLGMRFRRQHPIGPYIADFYADSKLLVIELDGEIHLKSEQIEHDKARDEYLQSRGLTVKRYSNSEVLQNLESVLMDIKETIKAI